MLSNHHLCRACRRCCCPQVTSKKASIMRSTEAIARLIEPQAVVDLGEPRAFTIEWLTAAGHPTWQRAPGTVWSRSSLHSLSEASRAA